MGALENESILLIYRSYILIDYEPGRRVFVQAKLFSAQIPVYNHFRYRGYQHIVIKKPKSKYLKMNVMLALFSLFP